MIKNELQNILSGKGEVKYGEPIQTIACYLRRSSGTSTMVEEKEQNKSKETEKLCQWIEENNLWIHTIDIDKFISQGAEQKVYLHQEEYVIKLNDSIYYLSWLDYFYNLLLNNYFFPDTAYKLLGFYKDKNILYAVVQQKFVKATELTSLENVREFMANNGFQLIRNNDYKNQELGIILEDLHDENVLTVDGVLAFIDTVFYLEDSFWE
ncbi:putative polyvalent protein kinase domain-containing protein [Capnocytophaga felis]|uniref:Uncharacterized protein n=1 Tax=Capnocytophaga felis TaxID=2267611 RepID=A0A5M4BB35_9FLAO|nr:hypothetical protein [Capnocytophaga felis]GET46788.1 hypothetical protein RCZ01_20900 [Capnocytophaga felis]GET48490.1 hypothetical protein RCZ02_13210 [Capnocytophaga felis]